MTHERIRTASLLALDRAGALRATLLAALGLSALPGCVNCPDPAIRDFEATVWLQEGQEACPEISIHDEDAWEWWENVSWDQVGSADPDTPGPWGPEDCETDFSLRAQTDMSCTYTIRCEEWSCCGYGRPYLDETGQAVAAGATDRTDWSSSADIVALQDLTEAEREALSAFWLKNAAAEHSSVAGFHRFALDLLAHGAPPELIREAGHAATQEITHALDCFTLASAYAGRRLGPEALDMGTHAPIARSLAELAAWTARDGAIGETVAATLAAEALEHATDPEVRRALEVVVRDETAHAELAWRTLAWALAVGGDDVHDAVHTVFASIVSPRTAPTLETAGTLAHGLLPARDQDAAARRCIDEVLLPVMHAVLMGPLAA